MADVDDVRHGPGQRPGCVVDPHAHAPAAGHRKHDGRTESSLISRLHVSRKTASHHVSHILTKLGLRNRTEAAACAATLLGERREAAPPG